MIVLDLIQFNWCHFSAQAPSWTAPEEEEEDGLPDTAIDDFEHYDASHGSLPAALRNVTYAIVDTGASTHLENVDGCDGFQTREATNATVSTGLSSKSPCDFMGTHVQYMLGCAPQYDIVAFRRPTVLCPVLLQQGAKHLPVQPASCSRFSSPPSTAKSEPTQCCALTITCLNKDPPAASESWQSGASMAACL
ncbi:hypothetical protein AB1Y20_022872 [Prymnesium parvum]|uniref:Subtilisin n=1 Tax=Prymnesium parvum TaxID=97485 RepID=A0AB34JF15_PRYPA